MGLSSVCVIEVFPDHAHLLFLKMLDKMLSHSCVYIATDRFGKIK